MPKLIIGLVGQAGSGKGAAADILKERFKAGYIRFSGILGTVLDTLGIEKSRTNFTMLSNGLRDEFGEDALSYAVGKIALQSEDDIIVVDGIRRPEDIVALEPLPHFKLISIDVPPEIRFERMKKRGEKASEANMTWEQFQREEKLPTEITIPIVMERAWKTIPNTGTKEELEQHLLEAMTELGFAPVQ
jgi:dephospho-CoA kinase